MFLWRIEHIFFLVAISRLDTNRENELVYTKQNMLKIYEKLHK